MDEVHPSNLSEMELRSIQVEASEEKKSISVTWMSLVNLPLSHYLLIRKEGTRTKPVYGGQANVDVKCTSNSSILSTNLLSAFSPSQHKLFLIISEKSLFRKQGHCSGYMWYYQRRHFPGEGSEP